MLREHGNGLTRGGRIMKNAEKYSDEIISYKGSGFCSDFIELKILKPKGIEHSLICCTQCNMICTLWLNEEYQEPEPDWSEIEVDTPVLVRRGENEKWKKRHFAKYENGIVYVWRYGWSSFTANGEMFEWKYAKLAEKEK